MDKRFQVFISSTFTDLKEERQSALRAVLELDHMPAGMELFPASDDSAWQLIRDVIDASDYYILIIGGRYGSVDEEGIGYTEKEYDYAISTRKPVIALLHQNPNNLAREKTEIGEASWQKLEAFRNKVEKRHTCVYWNSAEELKARLIVGLTSAAKRHPAVGWVRADQVPSGATLSDLLALRQRVEELEQELETQRTAPPPGTEDLLQGDDTFEINFEFVARKNLSEYPFREDHGYTATIEPSWKAVFAGVAPKMINEAADQDLRSAFQSYFTAWAIADFGKDKDLKGRELRAFKFKDVDLDTCIVQLRALGLITHSQRKRSLRDTGTYWTLTPFGDRQMVILRALRRTPLPERKPSAKSATDQAKS
jgi:hypothetical protein